MKHERDEDGKYAAKGRKIGREVVHAKPGEEYATDACLDKAAQDGLKGTARQ